MNSAWFLVGPAGGGGQANICGRYAENLFRALFGAHPQIFSKNDVFFPQHFRDPPIFSRKRKYFPLKFGDLPTIQQLVRELIDFESDGLANILRRH